MEKFRNFAPWRVFTKRCGGFEASSIDDLRSTASSYVGGTGPVLAEKRSSGMPVSSVPSARLCTCLLLLQLLFFRLSLFLGFAKKTRLFDVFRAMNEWRQPPNLRRSRSICVTKYVKRDPIRRTSLSTDFHKNQCNGSVVETPISQVGFHCFVYSYFLHCVRFMEWKWFLVPTKLTSYSCKCTQSDLMLAIIKVSYTVLF